MTADSWVLSIVLGSDINSKDPFPPRSGGDYPLEFPEQTLPHPVWSSSSGLFFMF